MNPSKLKIDFHPKRLSHSKSRDKYSPYRQKTPKRKHSESQENKQRIVMQQPIIRIKSLMDGTSQKTKLKLKTEPYFEPYHRCMTQQSNQPFSQPQQAEGSQTYTKLIEKIQGQTEYIKQGFKELNHQMKLPKLIQKQGLEESRRLDLYEENQNRLLRYLEQIDQTHKENHHLNELMKQYEKKIKVLEFELEEKSKQCIQLLQDLSIFKVLTLLQEKPQNLPINVSCHNDKEKTQSFLSVKAADPFDLSKASEIKIEIDNSGFEQLLAQKQNDIQRLKESNRILIHEIQQLNSKMRFIYEGQSFKGSQYQLEKQSQESKQKDKSLDEVSGNNSSSESSQKVLKESTLKQSKKSLRSVITKKTQSFLIQGDSSHLDLLLPSLQKNRSSFSNKNSQRRLQRNYTAFIPSSRQITQERRPNRMISMMLGGQNTEGGNSESDKKKLYLGRSFLKDKNRQNRVQMKLSKDISEALNRWSFRTQNFTTLESISKTISYKLKGFRKSYESVQNYFIQKKNYFISQIQIQNYFSDFPFLLSDSIIKHIIKYIFRNQGNKEERTIEVDKFFNSLREIIPRQPLIDEDVEILAMQRIRNTLLINQQQIIQQIQEYEDEQGVISHQILVNVLKQYSLGELELNIILSQCCIISTDYLHLNYKMYFGVLKGNSQETEQQS